MPGRPAWRGGLHVVTQVVDEICDIFRELGFTRAVGPEAETEWYNFGALNFPKDHPAVDAQDSFYLGDGLLLRTHTSPVQVRTMERYRPPIRVVSPGQCYRRDPFDPSHSPVFEQIEGLVVDEAVTFVDLKATLSAFARRFFGPETGGTAPERYGGSALGMGPHRIARVRHGIPDIRLFFESDVRFLAQFTGSAGDGPDTGGAP